MEKYNYRHEITDNIKRWLENNKVDNIETDLADYLNEELWNVDSITGNGAYWYDTEDKCAEYICHNLDLVIEACDDLSVEVVTLRGFAARNELARYLDCTIRCYLLYECIDKALEELNYE